MKEVKILEFHLWSTVLVYLYNHRTERITALTMCKHINSTPGSISKNIMILKDKGLLEFERKGRVNEYVMTDKGLKIAELLSKVFIALK